MPCASSPGTEGLRGKWAMDANEGLDSARLKQLDRGPSLHHPKGRPEVLCPPPCKNLTRLMIPDVVGNSSSRALMKIKDRSGADTVPRPGPPPPVELASIVNEDHRPCHLNCVVSTLGPQQPWQSLASKQLGSTGKRLGTKQLPQSSPSTSLMSSASKRSSIF